MFKSLLKQLLERAGYSLRRNQKPPQSSIELQAGLLRNAGVIFDVGAHIGQTAIKYRKCFGAASIYAFEPFPASFAILKESMPGDSRFYPQNLGLSDESGTFQLTSNRSSATNSLLQTSEAAADTWGNLVETVETLSVPVSTIDRFCASEKIEHIDILKMDVQGAELKVLRGARDMLSQGRVSLIYSEILIQPTYEQQATMEDMLSLLRGHGYVLHDLQNLVHTNATLGQLDAVFLKR